MPNIDGNRKTKTILGNREHKKSIYRLSGNRRISQFISGDQENRYPSPAGRASVFFFVGTIAGNELRIETGNELRIETGNELRIETCAICIGFHML